MELNTELNHSYLAPVVYMDLSNNSFEYFNPDSSLLSARTDTIELIDLSNNLLDISSVCKIQERLNSEKSRVKDVVNVDFYPQSEEVESWNELCNFLISVQFSTGEMDSRPLFQSCEEYSRNFTLTCLIIEHQKDKWFEFFEKNNMTRTILHKNFQGMTSLLIKVHTSGNIISPSLHVWIIFIDVITTFAMVILFWIAYSCS